MHDDRYLQQISTERVIVFSVQAHLIQAVWYYPAAFFLDMYSRF